MKISTVSTLYSLLIATMFLSACGGGGGSTPPPPPPPPPPPSSGMLELSAATYDVDESSTTASFMVTRTGGSSGTVTVDISTGDDTAVAGDDYGSITTTATFGDGDSGPKTGTFVIFDDTIDEPDETVRLTLSGVTGGATLGAQASALVTIHDDDPAFRAVGGTVTGLSGSGMVLRNNGGDDLALAADGSFAFNTLVVEGGDYGVSVATQPWAPAQSCEVANGSGVVGTIDVVDVQIDCSDAPLQSLIVRRWVAQSQNDVLSVREDGSGSVALADTTDSETFDAFAGERVVFHRNTADGSDIYSILPDGSDLLPLANETNQERFGGIASGGDIVLFNRQAGVTAATDDVYVIGADGSGLLPIAASQDDEEFRAVVTFGGRERVVYIRTVAGQDDIYTVNLDGTDPIAITATADYEEFVAVTPGGRVLFQRLSGGQWDLYSVNADGTALVVLGNESVNEEFVAVLDNERVLFWREIAASQLDLFAVNADGTSQATLANSSDQEVLEGVTPGGRVVYRRVDASGQSDLYAIDDDGTGLTTIAAAPTPEALIGVLPGDRLLYIRYDGPNSEFSDLFVIGADGAGEVQLTNTVERESTGFHVYMASGRVIFEREIGAQTDLFSILPDGTDERRLTDAAGIKEIVGATSTGGVLYELDDGGKIDLLRIGADGNGAAVLSATADDERLIAIH